MGKPAIRIYHHRIVLIVARRERGIALKNLLARFGCEAIIAMGLYEGIQLILQEMPHLVLTESSLPDGDAGLLYDRLLQNSKFKDTPILVNVLKKTRKELESLAQRKFAGFFLGVSDPSLIIAKVQEVLKSHCLLSPYHLDTEDQSFNLKLSIVVEAKILGQVGNFLVSTSPCELDYHGIWNCRLTSESHAQLRLTFCSNLVHENIRFNLFPISSITDRGRSWIEQLPKIRTDASLAQKKIVIFYHPMPEQGARFVTILLGYGVKGISITKVEEIKALLTHYKSQVASVVFDQLPAGYSLKDLDTEYATLIRKYQFICIIASEAIHHQNTHSLWLVRKPYGLRSILYRIFASFYKPKDIAVASKDLAFKGHHVFIGTRATVIGLDESGGFLAASFPIYKGAQLMLDHEFFKKILGDQARIEITGLSQVDTNLWYMRFNSVAKGQSKIKYLEKVIDELENALVDTGKNGTFLTQKS